MSIALQHRQFRTNRHLDADDINANLLSAQRDVNENLSRRYTYSVFIIPLAGMANTNGLGVRSFEIRPPGSAEVTGIEVRICATAGVTWVLSSTGDPVVSVDTLGATTEATGFSEAHELLTDVSAFNGILSCASASTIVAGEVVVHLRTDRNNQDVASQILYTPNLYDLETSTGGATADDALNALEVVVERDTDNDIDLRAEVYAVRNLGGSAVVEFQCPSGARRLLTVELFVAAVAGRAVSLTVGGGVTIAALEVVGAGVGVVSAGGETPSAQTIPDDPLDTADDTVVTLTQTTGGATVAFTYAILWWS